MQHAPFRQRYEILEQIGAGQHSKVFKVKEKSTGALLACKEIDYGSLPPETSTALTKAIEGTAVILKGIVHKHIIRYHEVLHDKPGKTYRIIMPYYELQDLQTYTEMLREDGKVVSEQGLWVILSQLISALDYLHSDRDGDGGIAHLNVNPANILLTDDFNVILTGFTNSIPLSEMTSARNMTEKLSYCAPEVLQGLDYGAEVDIWALACTIYELATSSSLFLGITPSALLQAIKGYNINVLSLKNYSIEISNVLKSMLTYNAQQRITAAQLCTHPKIVFYLTHHVQLQGISVEHPELMDVSTAPQSQYRSSPPRSAQDPIPAVPPFALNKADFIAKPQPDSLLLVDQTVGEQSYLNYAPAKASSRIRSTSTGRTNDKMADKANDSILSMLVTGRRSSSRGVQRVPEPFSTCSTMVESTLAQEGPVRSGSGLAGRSRAPSAHRYDTLLEKSIDAPLTASQAVVSRIKAYQYNGTEPNTMLSEVPSPEVIKEKPGIRRVSQSLAQDELAYGMTPSKQLLQTRCNPEGEIMSAFADDPTELIASHMSPQVVRIRIARDGGTEVIQTTNSAGEAVPRYQTQASNRTSPKNSVHCGPTVAGTQNSSYLRKTSPSGTPQLTLSSRKQVADNQEMLRCYPIDYVNSVNSANQRKVPISDDQLTYQAHVEPMSGHVPYPLPQGDDIYGPYPTGPAQYYNVPLNSGLQGTGQLYIPNDLQAFKQAELNFSENNTGSDVTRTIQFIDAQSYTADALPYTDLMKAVIRNDLKSVKNTISADAGKSLPGGITALMIAANMGHVECVKMLVAKEGGMRQKDGTTALMEAVQKKHGEVIKHLMKKEAGMRRSDGWTSLMYCAQHDLITIGKQLMAKEVGLQTISGVTALMIACEHGHLEMATMLLKEAGKNAVNGWTALMSACEHNYTDLALKLASKEAGKVKVDGWTALMSAARNGNIKVAKVLKKKEVKCMKNDGSSALMWAASIGNIDMVKLLMNEERHIRTVTGKTAFDFAEETDNREVMKLLRPDFFDKSGAYTKGGSQQPSTVQKGKGSKKGKK